MDELGPEPVKELALGEMGGELSQGGYEMGGDEGITVWEDLPETWEDGGIQQADRARGHTEAAQNLDGEQALVREMARGIVVEHGEYMMTVVLVPGGEREGEDEDVAKGEEDLRDEGRRDVEEWDDDLDGAQGYDFCRRGSELGRAGYGQQLGGRSELEILRPEGYVGAERGKDIIENSFGTDLIQLGELGQDGKDILRGASTDDICDSLDAANGIGTGLVDEVEKVDVWRRLELVHDELGICHCGRRRGRGREEEGMRKERKEEARKGVGLCEEVMRRGGAAMRVWRDFGGDVRDVRETDTQDRSMTWNGSK